MEVKAAKQGSINDRLGGKPTLHKVCKYWLAGSGNRYHCRFIHSESLKSDKFFSPLSGANYQKQSRKRTWRNPKYSTPMVGDKGRVGKSTKGKELRNDGSMQQGHVDEEIVNASTGLDCSNVSFSETIVNASSGQDSSTCVQLKVSSAENTVNSSSGLDSLTCAQLKVSSAERTETDSRSVQATHPKQCKFWINGNCVHGDKCMDLHCWFYGSGFSMLTKLEGHCKAISGISLPSGHDKLYSVDNDGCIRVWDCSSGQCNGLVNLDGEVGCLITEGPWLFAGLDNFVKAWNLQSQVEYTLNGSGGLVCSMATCDDKLFVGTKDGSMLVWKWKLGANTPELAAILKEHDGAVRSLVVEACRLYSGSRDGTIKIWDLENLRCLQTLYGHTRDVTAIVCCDGYLVSASLDNTIKVWALTESGSMEVTFEVNQDYGLTGLCSMKDAEAKSLLLCSLNDNTVRLYDLPLFAERGRIFSRHDVQVIQSGIDGLFFTGDASGETCVWMLTGSACTKASNS